MRNSKGFTLIELLAVIVILAIIALIATPIILNVIDTARKGSKESSTLGYIDAVEKQVMLAQVDSSATNIPSGTYTVEQLGNLKVEVKGEKPDNTSVLTINNKGAVSEGWFTYSGTNYKIYYNGSKAVANTTEDYVDENGNKHNEIATPGESSSTSALPSMAEMCPGCKFMYTTDRLTVGTSTMPNDATDDYATLAATHPFFLGLIANSSNNIIERAFACGIEKGQIFCLEGIDNSKEISDNHILEILYPDCNPEYSSESNTFLRNDCGGSNYTISAGIVLDTEINNALAASSGSIRNFNGYCQVGDDEGLDKSAYCVERD